MTWLSSAKWLLSLRQREMVSDIYYLRVFRDHCLLKLTPVCIHVKGKAAQVQTPLQRDAAGNGVCIFKFK